MDQRAEMPSFPRMVLLHQESNAFGDEEVDWFHLYQVNKHEWLQPLRLGPDFCEPLDGDWSDTSIIKHERNDPELVEMLLKAGAKKGNDVSLKLQRSDEQRYADALKTIRELGNNEHHVVQWIQRLAAWALEPGKVPHPSSS